MASSEVGVLASDSASKWLSWVLLVERGTKSDAWWRHTCESIFGNTLFILFLVEMIAGDAPILPLVCGGLKGRSLESLS